MRPILKAQGRSVSYDYFLMPLGMTLNIDGQGETGDMARHHQDMDCQRRGPAPQSLGPDAQLVDLRQDLRFQPVQLRIRVPASKRAEQALLRQERSPFEVPADPDPHNRRGTRVGS